MRGALRPSLGTSIAPLRRGQFRQTPLRLDVDVALDVPGPEARQVRAVAERLVRGLVAEADQARLVRRRVLALAVVEDLEPGEGAGRLGDVGALRDHAADLGAPAAVVDVHAGGI